MSRMRQRWRRAALLLGLVLSVAREAPAAKPFLTPNPVEPTVTREEAALLQQVSTTAVTNRPAAMVLFEKVDLGTSSAALDFALGNLHFQAEQLDQAETAYRAALAKVPQFRGALMNLGRVYLMQERSKEAIALYQQWVQAGRADADTLMLLGHALLIETQPVSAENAFRQLLLLEPGQPDALTALTKCLLMQRRYAEALGLLEEVIRTAPTNKDYWSLRVNALLALDDTRAAVRVLETARRIGAVDHDMLALLGDLYLNAGLPDDAVAAYQAAFAGTRPSLGRLLRAVDGFLSLRQTVPAGALLKRADALLKEAKTRDDEVEAKLLRFKADVHRLEGHPAAAKAGYQALLKRSPLDGDALMRLGALLREEGALEAAVIHFEQAARIDGFEVRALLRQAQIEVDRERYARAVELLEAAQAFTPQPHVARYLEQVRRLKSR